MRETVIVGDQKYSWMGTDD